MNAAVAEGPVDPKRLSKSLESSDLQVSVGLGPRSGYCVIRRLMWLFRSEPDGVFVSFFQDVCEIMAQLPALRRRQTAVKSEPGSISLL